MEKSMVGGRECRESVKPFQKNYFLVRILMNFMWRPVAGKHIPRNRQALRVYKALQALSFLMIQSFVFPIQLKII